MDRLTWILYQRHDGRPPDVRCIRQLSRQGLTLLLLLLLLLTLRVRRRHAITTGLFLQGLWPPALQRSFNRGLTRWV
jgi:hypothetical protein